MTYSQIEEEFKGIKRVNELKKVYKKLYPDFRGTNELFKMLNEIHNPFTVILIIIKVKLSIIITQIIKKVYECIME